MGNKTIGFIKDSVNRAFLRHRIEQLGMTVPVPSEVYDLGLHLLLTMAERNSPNDIYTQALMKYESNKLTQ